MADSTQSIGVSQSEIDAAYEATEAMGGTPLWRQYANLFPKEPVSRAVPYHWRFAETVRLLEFFTKVMSLEEAERRVIMYVNPGLRAESATLRTLFAGIQAILPGEVARPHRHSANAFRFILKGTGAYTTVNGEPVDMRPGDLLLTPGWFWHDHTHEGEEPMYWLDGLDFPLVNLLESAFFEAYDGECQPLLAGRNEASRQFTYGRLNPVWLKPDSANSPMGRYPWEQTRAALDAIGDSAAGTAADGILLEYSNPWTGGPVMSTISCRIGRLPPGFHGSRRRTTANTIVTVVEGEGVSEVGGETFRWSAGDTFCIPAWTWYEHATASTKAAATLFSYTDEPVFRSLGLFREEGDAD